MVKTNLLLVIMLLYLPPYSPDLSPIKESFSTWKVHLCWNGVILRNAEDLIFTLLELVGCIMAEMVENWFKHTGYVINDT